MKKLFIILSITLLLFTIYSFTLVKEVGLNHSKYVSQYLKDGDSISFGASMLKQIGSSNTSIKIGSYDGKRLEILDTTGRLVVSNLKPSNGLNSSDLLAVNVSGKSVYKNDTLLLEIASEYANTFVFQLNKTDPVIDVFGKNCKVRLVSQTLEQKPAQLYWSSVGSANNSFDVTAIPFKVKIDEVYKATHKENTIAMFDFFEISDGTKTIRYDKTDVVLLGGETLINRDLEKK